MKTSHVFLSKLSILLFVGCLVTALPVTVSAFGYVTGGSTLSVIDTTTTPNTVVESITVGDNAEKMAVSPDGKRVYVTASENGDYYVNVIDTTTTPNTVVNKVYLDGGVPRGMAVSPDNKRVYASMVYYQALAVIDTTTPNSVREYVQNQCSNSTRITVQVGPEYAGRSS